MRPAVCFGRPFFVLDPTAVDADALRSVGPGSILRVRHPTGAVVWSLAGDPEAELADLEQLCAGA